MVERVGGVGGLGPIREIGDKQKKVEKSKERERAEISSAKAEVEKVLEEAKRVSDVREKLVEEIRRAIESGDYVVDVEKIARKLLGGG